MPGLYAHTSRATGTILTAAIYNADHNNHVENQTPQMTDDYSLTVAQMQTVTNPGSTGSESVASSLAGELERIRYRLTDLTAGTNWYDEGPVINVKSARYGAKGDGVTDDTAAIQAAINAAPAYGAVFLPPPGLYGLTSGLTINKNGLRLFGGGFRSSGLKPLNDNAFTMISILGQNENEVSDLRIEKAGNRTQIGIDITTTTSTVLRNLWFGGMSVAIQSGSDSDGSADIHIQNITSENHNAAIIFEHNTRGVRVINFLSSGGTTGFVVRRRNGVDPFDIQFIGVKAENAASEGFFLDVGSGISLVSAHAELNGSNGFRLGNTAALTDLVCAGCNARNNGTNAALTRAERAGFRLGLVTRGSLVGCTSFDTQGAPTQQDGIYIDGASSNISILGGSVNGNVLSPIFSGSTTNIKVRAVAGFVTENSGTGTIANGQTNAVVTHGLSVTPTAKDISINFTENPTNDPGNIWLDNIGATQFRVNVRNDPGASALDFTWHAAVLNL